MAVKRKAIELESIRQKTGGGEQEGSAAIQNQRLMEAQQHVSVNVPITCHIPHRANVSGTLVGRCQCLRTIMISYGYQEVSHKEKKSSRRY
jgi:hypothetical protein